MGRLKRSRQGLWTRLILLALLIAFVGSSAGRSEGVTIKMATLAPDGSPWHTQLKEMGHQWQQRTDARVRMRLYPGGVAGDDPDMVRKMRIGQLHAAALTVAGLSDIDSAFDLFSIPMFFASFEEYNHVLEQMTPLLAARLEAKGFILLHWGHGGWVHLFSKQPVRRVDELRKVKLFTWAGDDKMVQAWKSSGFRPVALAATDIMTGLQTGMIDGLPTTPLAALTLQWFRHTPFMLENGVAPLIGATVISKRGWNKIPAADRETIRQAALEAQRQLDATIPQKDREAVAAMQKRGLSVIPMAGGEQGRAWQTATSEMAEKMKSNLPANVYDEAIGHRDAYRAARGATP